MINAWSLLYDELNGTMDENFPIKKQEDDDVTPCKLEDINLEDINITTATDTTFNVGSGNTASASTNDYWVDTTQMGEVSIDTSALDNEHLTISGGNAVVNFDDITFADSGDLFASMDGVDTLNINIPDDSPLSQNFLADNDDAVAHHFSTPIPGIEKDNPRKYKEDESIEALKNYISTTYNGHYTSKENNVQTLDLIESVGDAESFCRSNAIKYLSRYDKKGQAKRDILKALHYTLLLYHFSGQLNETPTRGYETF